MRIGVVDSGQKIVTNGLVMHVDAAQLRSYPGTGTTWTDISGAGNNGTLINGPTFNSANGGNIAFLNTSSQYVEGNAPITAMPLSVCAWFRISTIGTYGIISIHEKTNSHRCAINTGGTGTATVTVLAQGSSGSGFVSTSGIITANTWFFVSAIFPSTTSRSLYINEGTINVTNTTNIGTVNAYTNYSLGTRYNNSYGLFLNGNISTAMVYNRAISTTEITQNYNATKSRFGL